VPEYFEKEVLSDGNLWPPDAFRTFSLQTYYMGMVDEKNRVSFYDGEMRVVDPEGAEFEKFGGKTI
jgi:F420-non-reducing hydrogenase large subunit